MTVQLAAAEGLKLAGVGLDAFARLGGALKRDEIAQRIRAAGRVDDWARDDRRRDRRWRLERIRDEVAQLARALDRDDAGEAFSALVVLVQLDVELDQLAAIAELASALVSATSSTP